MAASLDLSDAFDASFFTDVVIKRYKIRVNDEGETEKIGFTAARIKAVVIPNDSTASNSQNNYNVTSSIQVYIKAGPNLNIQTSITPSDYIVYDGNEYKVTSAAAFKYGKSFIRVLAELASDYDPE